MISLSKFFDVIIRAGINLFKVNIRKTRIIWRICSKSTTKALEGHHVNDFALCSAVSIIDFKQVNAGWDISFIKVACVVNIKLFFYGLILL